MQHTRHNQITVSKTDRNGFPPIVENGGLLWSSPRNQAEYLNKKAGLGTNPTPSAIPPKPGGDAVGLGYPILPRSAPPMSPVTEMSGTEGGGTPIRRILLASNFSAKV